MQEYLEEFSSSSNWEYWTDLSEMTEQQLSIYRDKVIWYNLYHWIIGDLTWEDIGQLVDDAISFSRRVGAKHTLLTHVCHDIGLHEEVNKLLPEGIELAFDGQVLVM